jgi:hypothetical protein
MDFWFKFFDIHMNRKGKFAMIAMVLNGKTLIFLQS